MNLKLNQEYLAGNDPESNITVTLDFIPIAHLEEKQYFKLLSLQLISQIAKCPKVQQPLNLPIPANCREFCRVLKHLADLDIERITLITEGWERLPEPRKQKFLGLFQPSRSRRFPPAYKKKFKLIGFV
jgi:hypothetical protein